MVANIFFYNFTIFVNAASTPIQSEKVNEKIVNVPIIELQWNLINALHVWSVENALTLYVGKH
jgi:hypothetical protein